MSPEKGFFTCQYPSEYDCFCGADNPSEHVWVKDPGDRTVCHTQYFFGTWSYRTCIYKESEDTCTVEDMEDIST